MSIMYFYALVLLQCDAILLALRVAVGRCFPASFPRLRDNETIANARSRFDRQTDCWRWFVPWSIIMGC